MPPPSPRPNFTEMLAQHPFNRRSLSVTAAALLAWAVACSDSTGPDAISVEFNIGPPIIGLLLEPGVEVIGGPGFMTIAGRIPTATPCFDVVVNAWRAEQRVTVDVVAYERPGVACATVVATFRYRGAVGNLAAGEYEAHVFYAFVAADGTPTAGPAFHRRVEVVPAGSPLTDEP